MRISASGHSLWVAACLAACGGSPVSPQEPPAEPVAVCIEADCAQVATIATVPDAENLLLSQSGRLFVSGGTNVFEVRRTVVFTLTALAEIECNFTGLAERANTLYATCGNAALYAGAMLEDITLEPIHQLDGMGLPNGMAVGPDGCLYITDGPVSTTGLPSPQIVKVCLDPGDPLRVLTQEQWLALPQTQPNGITRLGQDFYITDSTLVIPQARVRRIAIQPNGEPGAISTLHSRVSVLDDLSVVDGRLLVTDFLAGSVFLLNQSGVVEQETQSMALRSPSSTLHVGAPLFDPPVVLVTEKGVLGDTFTPIGNRLSALVPIAATQ